MLLWLQHCIAPSGGFEWYVDPPPDLELWSRWTQAGCFSGLMHEQGSRSPVMDKSAKELT